MESKNRTSHRIVLALTASATLAAFWSGAAFARTQSDPDRAKITRHLESLDTPARTLAVDDVDHSVVKPDGATQPEDDAVDVSTIDLSTPHLKLGPRVSNALQDIFGRGEKASFDEERIDVPVSPVAESEDVPELSERSVESDATNEASEEIDLPLLQRQMYRTDI